MLCCIASSEADAEARLEEAATGVRAAVDIVKQVKSAARDSEHYTPVLGYKAFSEVGEAVEELNACKVAFDEARLERALLRMACATSKPRSLQSFSWRFGEGTASNATTCEYMLRACEKVNQHPSSPHQGFSSSYWLYECSSAHPSAHVAPALSHNTHYQPWLLSERKEALWSAAGRPG